MKTLSYRQTTDAIEGSTTQELNELIKLSIGRMLSMGSRPTKPGDSEDMDTIIYLVKCAGAELRSRGQL